MKMRRLERTGVRGTLAMCAVVLLALPATANAASVTSRSQVTTFPQPDVPPTGGSGPLIFGPDGQAWFTGYYSETHSPGEEAHYFSQIMRIDQHGQAGAVAHQRADGFTLGPDGNVWLTSTRVVSRLTASGEITSFSMPEEEVGQQFTQAAGPIVTGSDGNLWLSGYRAVSVGGEAKSVATIDRMTPAGEVTQFELPGPGSFPTRLALGPDGNVWFTEMQEDKVGKISPTGAIQMFPLPPSTRPLEIVLGSDGNLWVTEENDDPAALVRIDPSGQYTEFPLDEGISAGSLASGPDGRLWFASGPGAITRMTPSGRVSRVDLPQATGVADIVAGADGSVWYTALPEPPCAPGDSACGQGGSYESGIVGRIEPAPLTLAIDGGGSAAGGRQAKIRITCQDGTATAVCQGRVRLRTGRFRVAQRRFRLGTDLTRGINLRLTDKARDLLTRRGHLRVVCTVTLAGGDPVSRHLKLKPRKR